MRDVPRIETELADNNGNNKNNDGDDDYNDDHDKILNILMAREITRYYLYRAGRYCLMW